MKCVYCGKELPKGATQCPHCYAEVKVEAPKKTSKGEK
jgi:predicted amidophosphoribosyltransferase